MVLSIIINRITVVLIYFYVFKNIINLIKRSRFIIKVFVFSTNIVAVIIKDFRLITVLIIFGLTSIIYRLLIAAVFIIIIFAVIFKETDVSVNKDLILIFSGINITVAVLTEPIIFIIIILYVIVRRLIRFSVIIIIKASIIIIVVVIIELLDILKGTIVIT